MIARARWFVSRVLRRAANRIQPWDFLDAGQDKEAGFGPVDVEAVLLAYRLARGRLVFVQIGANEGNEADPLSRCIRRHGLRGLMIEPQAGAFEKLRQRYADQPQVQCLQRAIAGVDGEVTLYKVREDFWTRHGFPGAASEIASLDPAHLRRHIALFGSAALAAREAEWLETEAVPAVTLATLLGSHLDGECDFLQIDAEGLDYAILQMVDWDKSPPAMVYFEAVHLGEADRAAAWDLLRGHGYALFAPDSYNTLAIRLSDPSSSATAS